MFETYLIQEWDSWNFTKKVTDKLNELSAQGGKVSCQYSLGSTYTALIIHEKEEG